MTTKRHEQVGLTDAQVLDMYYYMLLARKIDERQWLLNRAGKVPFVISCQGQEAAQVGAAFALETDKDFLCPYYRDLGLVLVFGQTARDCMLSAFAKAEDPNSGGRQMPGHFGGKKYNILTGSSPVTTQVPHAVGMALAGKMQNKDFVVYTSFGEGSSNQGDFHEGANFAGVHKLPVIFFCENNKYAISVPLKKQLACESVADRALGYGFPGVSVDGNDPIEVYRVMKEAVDRARRGEGATLIEAVMYRLVPHSSDDDDRVYRTREEVEEAKKKDPLIVFAAYLREIGLLDENTEADMLARVQLEVDEATEYAENAPYPTPESTLTHVYGN
ncbi:MULTISPECIES: thiamine pyrophosphate-dependent dehydrogenase E1 component subunit alpha [Brevibacillus]|jgi:2-oxoisovalerate dehydrogenase E1 component alpha subunit|uniref:2-oxoisovalerate dehydrogenase subunit alpha n=1 Tax=Brevibacillus parabrevis TaxID=54914 RepID=A0A4Y3PE96_BREPA|nr:MULTISPECIES: thiamine pyrophosphate-dependent dehydrogenase E1 component subunit alpha [Brevibacillus]KZE55375.1 2-oxoisovalerate dehydrogenase [Brevibacillus parabrevis]MBU8712056.1 thiamine pyrophosphate-dependent dehydrogenase E1 component subunit alpha [Brevibacillus parabrevis]MDH6349123.1 2-oxoisovalerate dehydrogenase E1 component alpha subunit [Brevibacillus sp. 1238]MDR5001139.1 thiamine pyrophosphate-dependent dehydrogenase E1 component subunit alpha [Brevibacillus parabrevis]MED